MTPTEVLQFAKENGAKQVDVRFADIPGLQHHISYPIAELSESSFTEGFGIDGSSILGWAALNESDMLLLPVPETAILDPFMDRPTLALICEIQDPVTRRAYSRNPRSVARKCEAFLKKSAIADDARFGPETEFFVFDSVHYEQTVNAASYCVDSAEGVWNRGHRSPDNRGNQIRLREGYFPTPPVDTLTDLRSEIAARRYRR